MLCLSIINLIVIIILVAKGKEACKRLLTQTQLAATKIRIRLRKTKDSKLAAHVAMKERLESAPQICEATQEFLEDIMTKSDKDLSARFRIHDI